jgi:glycosyltransferase involved in cell wall biosynthesis
MVRRQLGRINAGDKKEKFLTDARKLKLAYFSPLNPVQSGISDYSEDLLPWLARYADLDLYVDNYQPSNKALVEQFGIYPAKSFSKQAGRYDTYLYHMGNSAAHAYIYQALKATAGQGILVLHDYVLHHFLIGEFLNKGKALDYIKLMGRIYGAEGERIAREVIKGKFSEALFWYPLCDEAIEAARAVLVHSHYAAKLINQSHPAKKVEVARMGVPLPEVATRAEARQRLGLASDEFILVSLGHLNPYKRLDSALWAFRAFSRDFPKARYILVGSPSPNYDVRAMIRALNLENKVQVVGYATGEAYRDYLAAADVCLNLRYPTAGETSASLLRIMGAGRPVMVSRTGSFEELPDEVCVKIDVDDAEEELLLEYLRLLANRSELREQLGLNARRYVAEEHRPADAAHDYYLFLCEVLGRPPLIEPDNSGLSIGETITLPTESEVLTPDVVASEKPLDYGLLGDVAQAIAELGISDDDPLLEEVAQALSLLNGPAKR